MRKLLVILFSFFILFACEVEESSDSESGSADSADEGKGTFTGQLEADEDAPKVCIQRASVTIVFPQSKTDMWTNMPQVLVTD